MRDAAVGTPGPFVGASPALPKDFDSAAFLRELDALRADLDAARTADGGEAELRHLRWVERVGWLASLCGLGLAMAGLWLPGAVGIALGRFVRWTCVAHHVLHRGYDSAALAPPSRTSRGFASGWRRLVDWPDWMWPAAWCREHNQLHHYRLGEQEDPDLVELNSVGLRPAWLPLPMRFVLVGALALSWRWLYFAPAAMREWQVQRGGRNPGDDALATGSDPEAILHDIRMDTRMLLPFGPGADVWRHSYLPYLGVGFALPSALALCVSPAAALSTLVACIVGEAIVNVHSFCVIVTNHSGGDVPRFTQRPRGRAELLLRQIVGSVNFRTGGFWNDLLHGYLNYQIEHHVWPDLSMRQLGQVQPKLRALCERHGVPYLQQAVWLRVVRLVRLMVGLDAMPVVSRLLPELRGATQSAVLVALAAVCGALLGAGCGDPDLATAARAAEVGGRVESDSGDLFSPSLGDFGDATPAADATADGSDPDDDAAIEVLDAVGAVEGSADGAADAAADAADIADVAGDGLASGGGAIGPPYPVVLAHGFFGTDTFAGLAFATYFFGVKADLQAHGEALTFTPAVEPFASSTVRGDQLLTQVKAILAQTGHRKVVLIGHSQGGLDARRVATLRPDLVAAVVTFSTPHKGSAVADVALGLAPWPLAQSVVDALVSFAGVGVWKSMTGQSSVSKAVAQLTVEGMKAFNAQHPMMPGVAYYSLAGRSAHALAIAECQPDLPAPFVMKWNTSTDPLDAAFWATQQVIDGGLLKALPHDGLVRVQDARFGVFLGCVPADHLDEMGQIFGDKPGLLNPFDHKQFYRELVQWLRQQGL